MSVIMGRMSRWDNMVVYPAVSQWSMDRALNTAGYTSEIWWWHAIVTKFESINRLSKVNRQSFIDRQLYKLDLTIARNSC